MALFHYKKEIVMEDYKNIIEKLKDDERFVEIVQETFFIQIPRYMPEIKDSSGFAKNARKSFIADM